MLEWTLFDAKDKDTYPENSRACLVTVQEFGKAPGIVVARFWCNSEGSTQWTLDVDTYGLERPYTIADEVTAWLYVPKPHEKYPTLKY